MKLDTNIHCDSVSRGKSNVKLWKSLIAIFINQFQCLYYELVLFVCLFLNGPSLTECVSIQTVNPQWNAMSPSFITFCFLHFYAEVCSFGNQPFVTSQRVLIAPWYIARPLFSPLAALSLSPFEYIEAPTKHQLVSLSTWSHIDVMFTWRVSTHHQHHNNKAFTFPSPIITIISMATRQEKSI